MLISACMALGVLAVASPPANAITADLSMVGGQLSRFGDSGAFQAFSLIFVSELGDKTFFIAALLAAKFSRAISFVGSLGALVVMTGISVGLGQLFHSVPSFFETGLPIDDWIAIVAFAYFGFITLKEAYELAPEEKGGELVDAEEALSTVKDPVENVVALIIQTFTLVFAAEFGDRSFLSTIALAAAQNPASVALGAIAAHAIATTLAVIGGAILSKYISEKTVGYVGGSLFILFAALTAIGLG